MKRIFLKSGIAALLSVAATIAIALTVVPMIGGVVDGTAWIMLIACPMLTAWPASAFTFWQSARLKSSHLELLKAHHRLAELNRTLEEKSRHDMMTGMLNRETFFSSLDMIQKSTQRCALLIIDADHFKLINDGYGHSTGDRALLEIVAALRGAVRPHDILGRVGGEEFAILLVGATERDAVHLAERIRQDVEQLRFMSDENKLVPLTVSIGGTPCIPGASVTELMRIADKRLYEAKNSGRNLAILGPGNAVAA